MGKKISSSLKKDLLDDIDKTLHSHHLHLSRIGDSFDRFSGTVMNKVREVYYRIIGQELIQSQLNSGAHEHLEDPDMQEIWKGVTYYFINIKLVT